MSVRDQHAVAIDGLKKELRDINYGLKNITEELKLMNDLRMRELGISVEQIKGLRGIKEK